MVPWPYLHTGPAATMRLYSRLDSCSHVTWSVDNKELLFGNWQQQISDTACSTEKLTNVQQIALTSWLEQVTRLVADGECGGAAADGRCAPPPHSSLTSEDTVQTPGPRRAVELSGNCCWTLRSQGLLPSSRASLVC
ncbi:hypothetical protein J6590_067762 [Homalodisca vitripennis]|nr:hypothetical protein J6590_067762 [Homalodisca vitripennis]